MSEISKPQKFSVYEPYTTIMFLSGWFVGYNVLMFYVYYQLQAAGYGNDVLIGLLLPLWILWFAVTFVIVKIGLLYRLLLRISFDSTGIHYHIFGYPICSIFWNEVHTFGVVGYSVSYLQRVLILFSASKKEYAPKSIQEANSVPKKRLIIQYRNDVWQTLQQHMPQDISKSLTYALNQKKDCFHRR